MKTLLVLIMVTLGVNTAHAASTLTFDFEAFELG
jgi:hypothetical protein